MSASQKTISKQAKKDQRQMIKKKLEKKQLELENLKKSLTSETASSAPLITEPFNDELATDKIVEETIKPASPTPEKENVGPLSIIIVPESPIINEELPTVRNTVEATTVDSNTIIQRLSSPVGAHTRGRKRKIQEASTSRKPVAKRMVLRQPKVPHSKIKPIPEVKESGVLPLLEETVPLPQTTEKAAEDIPSEKTPDTISLMKIIETHSSRHPSHRRKIHNVNDDTTTIEKIRAQEKSHPPPTVEKDRIQPDITTEDQVSPNTLKKLQGLTVPTPESTSDPYKIWMDDTILSRSIAEEERLSKISESHVEINQGTTLGQGIENEQETEPGEFIVPPPTAGDKRSERTKSTPTIPSFEQFEKYMAGASAKNDADKRRVKGKGKVKGATKPTIPTSALWTTPKWFSYAPNTSGPHWTKLKDAPTRSGPPTVESLAEDLALHKNAYMEGITKLYLDINNMEKDRKLAGKICDQRKVDTDFDHDRIKSLMSQIDKYEGRRKLEYDELKKSIADLQTMHDVARNNPPQFDSASAQNYNGIPLPETITITREDYYKMFKAGGEDILIAAARKDLVHPDILKHPEIVPPTFQRYYELEVALNATKEHLKGPDRREHRFYPEGRGRGTYGEASRGKR